MTPEIADKLMAFLNEMTEDGGDDETAPGAGVTRSGWGERRRRRGRRAGARGVSERLIRLLGLGARGAVGEWSSG